MPRPFTDISKSISANPIKNGSAVLSVTAKGYFLTLNTDAKNIPIISDIQSKYGYRYYNGMFVELVGNQTIVGA
jgi:hypothetical protein